MMYLGSFTQPGNTHGRIVRLGDSTAFSDNNPQAYGFDLHYKAPADFKIERYNDIYYGKSTPELGKWVCWELQFGPNTLGWWKDGVKITTGGNFPGTLMLSTLVIGWETYTPSSIELWLDDVAFDAEQRIGCPAAK